MRQKKVEHKCPNCGADLKRTIGPQTRIKYWVCTRAGIGCYRRAA